MGVLAVGLLAPALAHQGGSGSAAVHVASTVTAGATWWNLTNSGFLPGTFRGVILSGNGSLDLGPMAPPSNRQIVIDVGPSGSPDSLYARNPFVLRDTDGTYKMWYSGQDGSRNRMMYATSSDGVNWTKYGVIMDVQTPPDYFDSVGEMNVLKNGSTYEGWFSGGFWSGGAFGFWAQIYHATSTDAIHWNVTGVALAPNQAWDVGMVNAPWVIRDSHGRYWMYFYGWDGSNIRIGVATSMNGTSFTPYSGNPVIPLGPSGSWDSVGVATASVVIGPSNWTMWFDGWNAPGNRIGRAYSTDGFNWTMDPANPVFLPEPSPSWDDVGVGTPDYFVGASGPRLYFAGSDGTYNRIGMTTFAPPKALTYNGSYLSPVFDSGANGTRWLSLVWTGDAPVDTMVAVSVRTGSTPSPSGTWTTFASLPASGARQPPASNPLSMPRDRFFQFQINMTSTNYTDVPWDQSVGVEYAPNQAPASTPAFPISGGWTKLSVPVLAWSTTDPEADGILASQVQVSAAADFSTILVSSGSLPAATSVWQVNTSLSEGTWYWRVRAEDSFGLWGPWTSSVVRIDTTRPALQILSPSPMVLVHSSSLDVLWTASDSGSGVALVAVAVDGGTPLLVPAGNSSAHLTGLADGTHTVTVSAFDFAGNTQSVSLTVTVDTNVLSLTGPFGALPLVALIVGVVAGAGVVTFLVFRYRKAHPPAP